MRRGGIVVILVGSLASVGNLWSGTCDRVVTSCRSFYDYLVPPYELVSLEPELIRADLRRPSPFAVAQPTARTVRPVQDQRPALRRFTLARNDFAY